MYAPYTYDKICFILHYHKLVYFIESLELTIESLSSDRDKLLDEIKELGSKKTDKIDIYKKAETEMAFLRNELLIKEQALQTSLVERNSLLDR